MVTLTFVFNPEKVASVGSSEDELLKPMRDYARKYDISEDEYGVFSKDGEDAFCILTMVIPKLAKNNVKLLNALEQWTLNVDGEQEDCIQPSINWFKTHKPHLMADITASKRASLEDGRTAFLNLRQSAKENDLQDITLNEINAEIQLARKEYL